MHFAEINSENIVQRVIVADQEFIDSGAVGDKNNWIQTSYNTQGGVHYAPDSNTPDGGVALRKNYAGEGYTYDATRDAFYEPQPYPSWTLDDDTCIWNPPVACPDDGNFYTWNEENTQWDNGGPTK
jgi:hypothetical protein